MKSRVTACNKSKIIFLALHGCDQVVKLLLDLGHVDCNVQDSCGSTPIHDAVRSGSLDTFQILVSRGADMSLLNHEGYGYTVSYLF